MFCSPYRECNNWTPWGPDINTVLKMNVQFFIGHFFEMIIPLCQNQEVDKKFSQCVANGYQRSTFTPGFEKLCLGDLFKGLGMILSTLLKDLGPFLVSLPTWNPPKSVTKKYLSGALGMPHEEKN